MKINTSKLENSVKKEDGRIVARCPACSAQGADKKGNNLVVFPDGKFGCAAFKDDKEHNRQIGALVGQKSATRTDYKFPIKRLVIPESKVLLVIGEIPKPTVSQGGKEGTGPPSS